MDNENIGARIKARRLELHMTQKQLGEKCGIADSAVRKYESGKIKPKLDMLKRIAAALNISVYSLADFDTATELISDSANRHMEEYGEDAELVMRFFELLSFLTEEGKKKAIERVEEIAQIPKYQNKAAIAALREE